MCRYGECTAEHKEYIQHLMECDGCSGPSGHHCEDGWKLKLDNDAQFVCSLESLHERRRWMGYMRDEMPDRMADLERLITARFAEMKA